MGKHLLLDVSPTGVRHSVEIDDDGDGFTTIEYQSGELESVILDDCANLRGLVQRKGAHFRHAARIPIVTYELWKKEWAAGPCKTIPWPQFEVAKLNSRDNCNLRTGHKRGVFGMRL